MADDIVVGADEIRANANTLDQVADTYDSVLVGGVCLADTAVGHVELAENLPLFASFVGDVVAALASHAEQTAAQLRGVVGDMCVQEDLTEASIRSLTLPTFNGEGKVER
ncbi:hypothetical protein [Demequina globuliformis]|uniref:hypothetical protein n=1 Tax=Demequina globuliformis TaxID=676202 RepID=UPI0007820C33|nr:hypothetical protein [Demequina globuliformis]